MITPDVVAPGSCVIGGGMTWEGRKVLSDVDEGCAEVAGWVTPRLGGVGVTTVAMLLANTVAAAEASHGLRPGPSLIL
jgi:methylenetetrahydrofolate dehydrogenase (NADP+)/methenyltetrahydrofolate cyclohydrolase